MTPLTDEQRRLAARYVPLARKIARTRFASRWRQYRVEATSAAFLALCTAARDYREPSPIRFATFARWRIVGELGQLEVEQWDTRDDWWFDRSLHRVQGKYRKADGRMWRLAVGSRRDDPEAEDWLRTLPESSAEAIRLTYLGGLTQGDAANRVGVSKNELIRRVRLGFKLLGVA